MDDPRGDEPHKDPSTVPAVSLTKMTKSPSTPGSDGGSRRPAARGSRARCRKISQDIAKEINEMHRGATGGQGAPSPRLPRPEHENSSKSTSKEINAMYRGATGVQGAPSPIFPRPAHETSKTSSSKEIMMRCTGEPRGFKAPRRPCSHARRIRTPSRSSPANKRCPRGVACARTGPPADPFR